MSAEAASAAPAASQMSTRAVQFTSVAAAVVVALSFVHYGLSAAAFVAASFSAVLVVLSAIDLRRRIIPNVIVLPATAVVLVAQIAIHPSRTVEWVVAGAAAFAVFLVMALINPAGLGMGDVKLAALIGVGLGWNVVAALLLGTFAAALFGVCIIVARGRAAAKTAFPLGPFLAAGTIVTLLLLH